MSQAELDETAVENFREYLRIPSVHPDINYGERTRGSETRGIRRGVSRGRGPFRRAAKRGAAEARETAGEEERSVTRV